MPISSAAAFTLSLLVAYLRLDVSKPVIDARNYEFDPVKLTPEASLEVWDEFQEKRLERRPTPWYIANREQARRIMTRMRIAMGITVLGVGIAMGAILVGLRRR